MSIDDIMTDLGRVEEILESSGHMDNRRKCMFDEVFERLASERNEINSANPIDANDADEEIIERLSTLVASCMLSGLLPSESKVGEWREFLERLTLGVRSIRALEEIDGIVRRIKSSDGKVDAEEVLEIIERYRKKLV